MRARLTLVALVGLIGFGATASGSSTATATSAGDAASGLYVFDASTGALTQLLAGEQEREDLEWSPDGRWIASTDTNDFLADILQPDGAGRHRVVSWKWSRDGSRIAYATEAGLFVGPSTWTGARRVTAARGSDPIDWAPDGRRFAYGAGRSSSCCWASINIARADGSHRRKLWAPKATGRHQSWIDSAAWSPSGKQIAVTATINNHGTYVYFVSPDSGRVSRATTSDVGFADPEWSADGKWVVLGHGDSAATLSSHGGRLRPICTACSVTLSPDRREFAITKPDTASTAWVENVDGSGKRPVAERVIDLTWSPDSRRLAVSTLKPDGAHASLAVVDVASASTSPLTDGTAVDFPYPGLSSDGMVVAFVRFVSEDAPIELWTVNTDGTGAKKMLTLASGDLGPCPLAAWSPRVPLLALVNAACAPS